MSVSIYDTACRDTPLTPEEQEAIRAVVKKHSVGAQNLAHVASGTGLNWEPFHIYDPSPSPERGVIFEGATKLPDNTEDPLDAQWQGLQYWCEVLSDIRRSLSGASWQVHVDDHDSQWDAERHTFDPSL